MSGMVATYSEISSVDRLRELLDSVPNLDFRCRGPFLIIHERKSVQLERLESWMIGERCVLHVSAEYGYQVENREGEKLLQWEP